MNSGDPSTLLKPEYYCDDPTANPLVSTIVLSYNQSRFVLETLESVKAQTYKATQLIIVDDCSLDDSVATIDHWLQESGIHCEFIRHKKNQGICKSLNEALAVANGKYISMVASDDVRSEERRVGKECRSRW